MNWANFQTYNEAPTKAFEMLCNQLFENWCKEKYKSELVSFYVVNGAGGDGGVESYAVLSSGKIVGLQAKWFLNSISTNQMGQIKNSIETAMKIRPQIIEYVVCVPRNLASLTGKGDNTENARWENMKAEVLKRYPDLTIDLWNEARLMQELQKDGSAGIFKFWFERAEISEESIKFSFEKSKNSWLLTKYTPELNTYGTIHNCICEYVGDVKQRKRLRKLISDINNLCDSFYETSRNLIEVSEKADKELLLLLNETELQIQNMQQQVQKIKNWLDSESILDLDFEESAFSIDFDFIEKQLKENKERHSYYFNFADVIKVLQLLKKIRIHSVINQIRNGNCRKSLIFLGEPGTGKTNGIAAETERLLKENYHVPILIQARDIDMAGTWKDILITNLGLSNSWSEDEIWQGLTSLANRKRIHALDDADNVYVLPKIIIAVDGVDESSLHDRWIERAQETAAIIQKYPCIRFVFLSRPYVFRSKNFNGKIVNIDVGGDVPTYKLFDSYIKAYNVAIVGAEWVKYALKTPLALKLFCELNKNKVISYNSGADVSIAALLREKIGLMESEYCKSDTSAKVKDQKVLTSILVLSDWFSHKSRIERNDMLEIIEEEVKNVHAQSLVDYLENYGILRCYCEFGTGLLTPRMYFYYPGIQGYFDYAAALRLIDKYETPEAIDFKKCESLPRNSYYILAIVSIQIFNYLITDNESIKAIIDESFREELLFFALRHSNPSEGNQYKQRLLVMMEENAEKLKAITNNVILPLAREPLHPLGVSLLDDFLMKFAYPAQRDILWSVPCYLKGTEGAAWKSSTELLLGRDSYCLNEMDVAEGLPTVYAWALSTVDNVKRQSYRIELVKWAKWAPEEFYKLFMQFSTVNDPQIRSDIFSVFMVLLFENPNKELITKAVEWLMENILSAEKIDDNRDIAVRYYATSIVRKAESLKLIDLINASEYLPPYNDTVIGNNIRLSKEALQGTYMGGYKGITYDLGRYVLIDHISHPFSQSKISNLLKNIVENQTDLEGMTIHQFILSAAYEFLSMQGWKEDFCYSEVDGVKVYGVDVAISRAHSPKTHGEQSTIMTICEKYVWQARKYILGFLADRLMYTDDDGEFYITDYGVLDDFEIPALEIEQINSDSENESYPWHIPEKTKVIISGRFKSQDDVASAALGSPDIAWEKWIQMDNLDRTYEIDADKLLALYGYSCFESPAGIETNLYFDTILVNSNEVDDFIQRLIENPELSNRVSNPFDWEGGCSVHCYVTPKEVCWMPWKKGYEGRNIDEFPQLTICSAVDECVCNYIGCGDSYYKIPSPLLRELLQIENTDGHRFYDSEKKIKALSITGGENWKTQQSYLITDISLLEILNQKNMTLLWIAREERRENSKAREQFKNFYASKDYSWVGFFQNGRFISRVFYKKNEKGKDAYGGY